MCSSLAVLSSSLRSRLQTPVMNAKEEKKLAAAAAKLAMTPKDKRRSRCWELFRDIMWGEVRPVVDFSCRCTLVIRAVLWCLLSGLVSLEVSVIFVMCCLFRKVRSTSS